MKKLFALSLLILAGVFGANAQQTANQGTIGVSFLREDVKFVQPHLTFNENTDSFGVTASYTRFVVGGFGLTGELGANFDSNKANLVTALAGTTLQVRSAKYVQPFVKILGGVARQSVDRHNLNDFTNVKFAYEAGGGVDINVKANSRYKVRLGAGYVGTRFHGEQQSGVRLTTGIVF